MERILSAHRKCLGRPIAKKKPVKVVYISNPMRVTASAADFRALVQKLTGRDSDVDDSAGGGCGGAYSSVTEPPAAFSRPPNSTAGSTAASKSVDLCNSLVVPSEVFGGGFDAQVLESLCGILSAAAPPHYEPPMAGFGSCIRH